MKDSMVQMSITGIIGAFFLDLVMYLLVLLGIKTAVPWDVAADVFLTPANIHTASGTIIGLIGTAALNVAVAALTLILYKLTGFDHAVFKGIVIANAFGFITIGLFMPLLNIAPQVQQEPVSNYLALAVLSVTGGINGYILKRFRFVEFTGKQV